MVATRATAGTTATLLVENTKPSRSADESDWGALKARLQNLTGTASVFLGPAGVTTANGYEWTTAEGPLEVDLEPGEALYGIVAALAQTVHVLGQGR